MYVGYTIGFAAESLTSVWAGQSLRARHVLRAVVRYVSVQVARARASSSHDTTGHCKTLKPKFTEAAAKVAGKYVLAKIDCTLETAKELCQEFGVRGYPTLKFFKKGVPQDYTGPREASMSAGGCSCGYVIDFGIIGGRHHLVDRQEDRYVSGNGLRVPARLSDCARRPHCD